MTMGTDLYDQWYFFGGEVWRSSYKFPLVSALKYGNKWRQDQDISTLTASSAGTLQLP